MAKARTPKKKDSTAARMEAQKERAAKLARLCARAADNCKASDVIVLEMTDLSTLCDYFVICTGNSAPQLKAIADHIEEDVRKALQAKPVSVDGDPSSKWVVMDYGGVMVHILSPETRERYQLENVWGDAPRLEKKISAMRRKNEKA